MEQSVSTMSSQASSLSFWTPKWLSLCQPLWSDGGPVKAWLSQKTSSSRWMLTVPSSIGTPHQVSYFIKSMMNWTSSCAAIIITMEHSSFREDPMPSSEYMTSRLDSLCMSWNHREETTAILLKCFALNLIKRIQTTWSPEVGTTTSWCGISDSNRLSDPSMAHTFAETPLICMTDIYSLEHTQIQDSCSYGTSARVSQLKIFLGMRDSHQRKLVRFTELNSKRTPVTWLSLEEVAPTRWKCSTATTCSSPALKSKTWVELLSQWTSATRETCSLAVVETVSSEFSMSLTKFELYLR